MTTEEFERTLMARLQRRPFQPFVIEENDGEQFKVNKPEAIMYPYGGESAVYFDGRGNIDFLYSATVRQIRDCPVAASA